MGFADHLAGYLNDHLAGATLAIDLARESERHSLVGHADRLADLIRNIEDDRETLITVMERLGIEQSGVKQATAWLAEKASRLKFQAPIGVHDDVNQVLEIEVLMMGVLGKQAMWEALAKLAPSARVLDGFNFEEMLGRAGEQLGELNNLRLDIVMRG